MRLECDDVAVTDASVLSASSPLESVAWCPRCEHHRVVTDEAVYEGGVRLPEVKVQLSGEDGDVFTILDRVIEAMKRVGVHEAVIRQFVDEAVSADYDHLLRTCLRWVDVR